MKCKHPILTKTRNLNMQLSYARATVSDHDATVNSTWEPCLYLKNNIAHGLSKWPHYRGHANANTCNHHTHHIATRCIKHITYVIHQNMYVLHTSSSIVTHWYEPRDINHTIYFNEDVKKRLSKLSKDVFNSCYIEEKGSLIVVNFGWVTI